MHPNIIYQPEKNDSTALSMYARGELQGWMDNVCSQTKGQPYLIACLCAGFAAPLLKFSGIPSFFLHFYRPGDTSGCGKTTGLQVASSVHGDGTDPRSAPQTSFVRTWYNTANALEAVCAAHNDCLLALDEIKMCTTKERGKVLYTICGGQAKGAMSGSRKLLDQRNWRILGLSSGELSIRDFVEETGERIYSGQLVRFLDTPIIGSMTANEQIANKLKDACSSYFGTAGPAFIKAIIRLSEGSATKLAEELRPELDSAINSMPAVGETEAEKKRALRNFALLKCAGILAVKLLHLPLDMSEIRDSIDFVASAWIGGAKELKESDRSIAAVRHFIEAHRHSRFLVIEKNDSTSNDHKLQDADPRVQVINLAGYWDTQKGLYYFTEGVFKEACTGFSVEAVAETLKSNGFLDHETGRLQKKVPLKLKKIDETLNRTFAIKASILE